MLVVYDKKRIAVSSKNSYLFIKQQPIHKLFKGCAGVACRTGCGVHLGVYGSYEAPIWGSHPKREDSVDSGGRIRNCG